MVSRMGSLAVSVHLRAVCHCCLSCDALLSQGGGKCAPIPTNNRNRHHRTQEPTAPRANKQTLNNTNDKDVTLTPRFSRRVLSLSPLPLPLPQPACVCACTYVRACVGVCLTLGERPFCRRRVSSGLASFLAETVLELTACCDAQLVREGGPGGSAANGQQQQQRRCRARSLSMCLL